jgi:hypothetical protein
VVLYELLTGSCPFRQKNYHALLRAIVEDEPPSILERGVDDPELWTILRQGLSKQPEQRQSSLRELGRALARWMLRRGVTEDLTGASIRRTWLRDDEAGEPAVHDALRPEPRPAAPGATKASAPADRGRRAKPSRGGAQARALVRASRRRHLTVLLVLTGAIVLVVLTILWGAGLIGDLGRLWVLFRVNQARPS